MVSDVGLRVCACVSVRILREKPVQKHILQSIKTSAYVNTTKDINEPRIVKKDFLCDRRAVLSITTLHIHKIE